MFFKSVHGAAVLAGSFVAPKDLNTSDVCKSVLSFYTARRRFFNPEMSSVHS